MSDRERNVAKFAAILAGGAVVGAGLGLLFAPQSGSETRRQIRHYAKRTRYEATRVGRSVKAGLEKTIERGKALLPKRDEKLAIQAA